MRKGGTDGAALFIYTLWPISVVPGSPGYGDKLWRAIDAADPGAVPGGSTISFVSAEGMTGPN
jgi:hypothetical protein